MLGTAAQRSLRAIRALGGGRVGVVARRYDLRLNASINLSSLSTSSAASFSSSTSDSSPSGTGDDWKEPRHGHVLGATLVVDDVKAAKAFYSKIFPEWCFSDSTLGASFTVDNTGATDAHGAIRKRAPYDDAFSRWIPTFMVDDVPAAVDKCTAAGGAAAVVDANIGVESRRCVDPQGGAFFLRHRTRQERAVSDTQNVHWLQTPPPGAVNWLDGLGVPTTATSVGSQGAASTAATPGEDVLANFYADVLSLDVQHRFPFPAGTYILAFTRTGRRNGDKLCGFLPAAALIGEGAPAQWLVFFATADREDLVARTAIAEQASSGVEVIHRELDIQDGTVAIIRDPQGVHFALYYRSDAWDEVRDYSENNSSSSSSSN